MLENWEEAMADAVLPREMPGICHKDKHQKAPREADRIQATRTHTRSSGQWKVPRSAHQ